MIQPNEMKRALPMKLSNGVVSTTTRVWEMLAASHEGDVEKVKQLAAECPELVYAQYNYTPPIYFAVREGHIELVKYLLEQGACDPSYKTYPFLDNLLLFAQDRNYNEIAALLEEYYAEPAACKYKADNGEIVYERSSLGSAFQQAVDNADLERAEEILKEHPEFAKDETFFWSEGIMMMPAKETNKKMVKLLMDFGAKIPTPVKWAQFYYFEKDEMAAFLLENGVNANVMSWHRVSILHDMAQKGNIYQAELLIKHGADINAVDEEYRSTPLGFAARWGQLAMVELLLDRGADVNMSGAAWSTPLAWARKKKHDVIESLLLKAGAL